VTRAYAAQPEISPAISPAISRSQIVGLFG
jgi:hypothetical protein